MSSSFGNRAKFVEQVVPRRLIAGQQFEVVIRMQNVGSTNWTRAEGYKLGAQNPRDNSLWGFTRVELPAGDVIRPMQVKEFRFTVGAPDTAGIYNFQWQMLREFVEWFGDLTPNLTLRVLEGEATIRVLEKCHVIVCGYPRYPFPHTVGDVRAEEYNIRYPEYGYWRDGIRYARGQNTPEYGIRTRDFCIDYEIQVLTGWWENKDVNAWKNFEDAFGSIDLKQLRLAYMFGVTFFPDSKAATLAKVAEWAPDTGNSNRYAYITDAKGERRPIMMIWGFVSAANAGEFKTMITEVRRLVREKSGKNPFIIMSQHMASAAFSEIVTSLDALYQHECHIPPMNFTISTAESIPVTERAIIRHRNAIAGMKNSLTNLPVYFFPGTMPQFDRRRWPNDRHGTVEARSYQQVEDMFKMVRKHAPTIFTETATGGFDVILHKWVTITSMNEWAEGQTIEPSLVRGQKYQPPQCDYGSDFLAAIKTAFADRIYTILRTEFAGRDENPGIP